MTDPEITVSKMTAYVQASKQLLDDCPVIDFNAVFNPTWRQRIRRRIYAFRSRVAERAYRLIAGRDIPSCDREHQPEPDWDDD